jgi:hypothetical protein
MEDSVTYETKAAPEGYMRDSAGRLVPEGAIKPHDVQRDGLVKSLFAMHEQLQKTCKNFRIMADGEIDAHLALISEKYGVKAGGQVGNLVLTSFDGSLRIVRAVDKVIAFTEEIHAAKALIFACVREWTEGARAELRALVEDAFRQDKQGHLSADRILGLLRLDIQDERWKQAMQAIRDSVRVQATRTYMRFYKRQGDGTYAHIPASI